MKLTMIIVGAAGFIWGVRAVVRYVNRKLDKFDQDVIEEHLGDLGTLADRRNVVEIVDKQDPEEPDEPNGQ